MRDTTDWDSNIQKEHEDKQIKNTSIKRREAYQARFFVLFNFSILFFRSLFFRFFFFCQLDLEPLTIFDSKLFGNWGETPEILFIRWGYRIRGTVRRHPVENLSQDIHVCHESFWSMLFCRFLFSFPSLTMWGGGWGEGGGEPHHSWKPSRALLIPRRIHIEQVSEWNNHHLNQETKQ